MQITVYTYAFIESISTDSHLILLAVHQLLVDYMKLV
jgi:hypothetical protein